MPENENARAGEQRADQNKQNDSTKNGFEAQEKSSRDPSSIVFLQSAGNHRSRMAKCFYKDKNGKIQEEKYGRQTYFKIATASCANIHELARLLSGAEKYSDVCVVRGAPANGVNWKFALRRSVSRTDQPATFIDVPRLWAMIDIDKIPCPAAIDPVVDPIGASLYIVGLLPEEFRDISFYWQFSSSQGVYRNDTLSIHIWFYLDRPYTNTELKKYANSVNKSKGFKLIDPALFAPVQPHYIARPLFENILTDPIATRSGFWQGLDDYATLNIPTEAKSKPAYKAAADYCPGIGYQGYLKNIGDDKGGFYKPVVSAIASYVAANGVEGTDPEAIKADIRAAIDAASVGNRTIEEIERYKSNEFLGDIFEWVFARERERGLPPETVTSMPPYYAFPAYPNSKKDEAAAHMKRTITDLVNAVVEKAAAVSFERILAEFGCLDDDAA